MVLHISNIRNKQAEPAVFICYSYETKPKQDNL